MKYAFPLAAVIALVLVALILVQIPGMQYLFGVVVPYLAMALFLGGFCYRVIHWAKSPVPFKIPTTCGQGYSLPWIKQDKLEAPVNTAQVVARMFLEIVLFRSLWRNTKATVYGGPNERKSTISRNMRATTWAVFTGASSLSCFWRAR